MKSDINIEEMIPHAGQMVLIDEITAWDQRRITCRTATHRDPDNPLRNDTGLPAAAGVEYGGQASALHGALIGSRRDGFLVAIKDMKAAVQNLNEIEEDLLIDAVCLGFDTNSSMYTFEVSSSAAPDDLLVSGRITIALAGDQ